MIRNRMTITIAGKAGRLTVKTVIAALSGAGRALHGVAKDISSPESTRMEWQIEDATMKSPLALVLSGRDLGESGLDVVNPFIEAVKTIETSTRRPRFLTDDTIRQIKTLVAILNDGAEGIIFSTEGNRVQPTQHLAANADAILHQAPKAYETLTELDGKLEEVSIHGDIPEFRIYDVLTDKYTQCAFDPKDIDRVADMIKDRARVRVRGTVKYDSSYRPISIKVESFSPLRKQEELPQMRDLQEAGINITGGVDAADFVRGLRDAE